jgi:hypothetical protein
MIDESKDSSTTKPTFLEKYGSFMLVITLLGGCLFLVFIELVIFKK